MHLMLGTPDVGLCYKVAMFVLGCAFLTFYTRQAAIDAQNALHGIKTLPGVSDTA